MTPETNFKDLSFNISNYCLSKCKYCGLHDPKWWELDKEMNLEHIERFLADPILGNLDTIHLTGGEPFLSPKFLAICDIMAKYHKDVPMNMPSNGLFPNLVEFLMRKVHRKLPQLRINIGLEGPTAEIHDRIRGKDTFDPAIESIKRLTKLGVPVVGNMSLQEPNYKFIRETYTLTRKLGIGFYFNFLRNSIRFGNKDDSILWYEKQEEAVKELEGAAKDIGWMDARPFNRQKWKIQNAKWEEKTVKWQCKAGIEGIDVFPTGDVYPCLMYYPEYKFGNIKSIMAEGDYTGNKEQLETPLTAIMTTPKAKEIQDKIYSGECSLKCPFTCQLRMDNLTIDGERIDCSQSL